MTSNPVISELTADNRETCPQWPLRAAITATRA